MNLLFFIKILHIFRDWCLRLLYTFSNCIVLRLLNTFFNSIILSFHTTLLYTLLYAIFYTLLVRLIIFWFLKTFLNAFLNLRIRLIICIWIIKFDHRFLNFTRLSIRLFNILDIFLRFLYGFLFWLCIRAVRIELLTIFSKI